MHLYERLRELRHERGLRLKDVAATSGGSVPDLSDLERGRTNPGLDRLQTLARAYGTALQGLLEGMEFSGGHMASTLPQGLAELVADAMLGGQITPDWVRTLPRIELCGQRPGNKEDWFAISLPLKRILS